MSDHIPFHIQEEIMKRLPVKSLVQFRCVSKAWKSLIDSSQFIAAHSLRRHTQPQHLLVTYDFLGKYVSFIDDDTFPQQRSVLTTPFLSVKQRSFDLIAGSSQGLLCFYKPGFNSKLGMVVLWNPSIRKSIVIDVPFGEQTSVGFGVCPVTCDPKIVAITQSWDKSNIEASYKCEVMVYTLSSGKWRSLSDNLPAKPIRGFSCSMVTDRFIYWRAAPQTCNMIMSFDVTSESFKVIALPGFVAYKFVYNSKLRESFVITKYNGRSIDTVWQLEHGVQRGFTKLFTIETQTQRTFIVGFTKSGIPLLNVRDGDPDDSGYVDEPFKLVMYQPNSEHNNVLHICRNGFTVNSYMETLLLIDRSECISY